MTPEQVRQRITVTIDTNRRHFHYYCWASKEMVGILDHSRVRFRRRRDRLYPFSPVFDGRLEPCPDGTILRGHFVTMDLTWTLLIFNGILSAFSFLTGSFSEGLWYLFLELGFIAIVFSTRSSRAEDKACIISFLECSLRHE